MAERQLPGEVDILSVIVKKMAWTDAVYNSNFKKSFLKTKKSPIDIALIAVMLVLQEEKEGKIGYRVIKRYFEI